MSMRTPVDIDELLAGGVGGDALFTVPAEHMPMTGRPRCLAPMAISTMTGRMPEVEMTIMASWGPKAKPFRISSA